MSSTAMPATGGAPARVATVIRCADLVRHVYAAVDSVARQTAGRGEIVLVTDPSTPARVRDWLAHFARARGLSLAHASSAFPGAVRNAGIRATAAPYVVCLDAGDLLDPRFFELSCAALDAEPALGVVTSSMQILGPGNQRRVVVPDGWDLDAILLRTDVIHESSMFRRSWWTDLDGFDESLPGLDAYDFWLRLLARGIRCAVLEPPLLIRALRTDSLHRRAWERNTHIGAMRTLVLKHRPLFERSAPAVLFSKECELQDLAATYREVLDRRDRGVQEIDTLRSRIEEVGQSLPPAERDTVNLADLRRTTPVSREWGYERGRPIDRYYIERFLERHAADIRGVVLEVQEADYTRQFGAGKVTRSDVVDLDPSNERATVVSDLRMAANIPSVTYDCVILTQTLHVIDDMLAALAECVRILKPGGVLLVTLPCVSRVALEYGRDGDFWRVTEGGARRLFSEFFGAEALDVRSCGNVLVNAAFLYGLGCHELTAEEFDAADPYFPLLVTVRAVKSPVFAQRSAVRPSAAMRETADADAGPVILLYHRIGEPASDIHGLAVPPQEFRAHLEHLNRQYRPMPLDELAAAVRDGRVPPNAVAVTFDDGYVDNLEEASPILAACGVPATFFITTDRLDIDEDYEFWWDVLERTLLNGDHAVPADLTLDLPGGQQTFATQTADERLAAHWTIYHAIVDSPGDDRDAVIAALRAWAAQSSVLDGPGTGPPVPADPQVRTESPVAADLQVRTTEVQWPYGVGWRESARRLRRMRPSEIVELSSRPGHAIGAHTSRHLLLPRQPLDVQRREIADSKNALETGLGHRIRAFAYPFGAFSAETVDIVRSASFEVALTCEEAPVVAGMDPLRLPRLEVKKGLPGEDFGRWLKHHRSTATAARRASSSAVPPEPSTSSMSATSTLDRAESAVATPSNAVTHGTPAASGLQPSRRRRPGMKPRPRRKG